MSPKRGCTASRSARVQRVEAAEQRPAQQHGGAEGRGQQAEAALGERVVGRLAGAPRSVTRAGEGGRHRVAVRGHVAHLARGEPELDGQRQQQRGGEGQGDGGTFAWGRKCRLRRESALPCTTEEPHDRRRAAAERAQPDLDRPRDDRPVPGPATASSRSPWSSPTRSSTQRVEGPVFAVHQSDAALDAMDAWNKGTHGRSGLIDRVKASTIDEAAAEAQVIDFLQAVRAGRQEPDVRQQHLPGPALPGQLHAGAGGLLPLPQPRRQHAEGTGAALEAGACWTASRRRRRTPRWPTSTSRSTSCCTTAQHFLQLRR